MSVKLLNILDQIKTKIYNSNGTIIDKNSSTITLF